MSILKDCGTPGPLLCCIVQMMCELVISLPKRILGQELLFRATRQFCIKLLVSAVQSSCLWTHAIRSTSTRCTIILGLLWIRLLHLL